MLVLDNLRKSQNAQLQKLCSIAYWEINGNRSEDLPETCLKAPPYDDGVKEPTESTQNAPKIMISYDQDYQKKAEKLWDDLTEKGFQVSLGVRSHDGLQVYRLFSGMFEGRHGVSFTNLCGAPYNYISAIICK